jgi:acyl carrier protein
MEKPTIETRILKIIIEQLFIDESSLTLESKIVEDLGTDSLDYIELIMAVEDEFLELPRIPDQKMKSFKTVNDIVKYIKEQTS